MDLEYINIPWSYGRVMSLLNGSSVIDDVSSDGAADVVLCSYYQLKCYAYDMGRQEAVLDCIHLEKLVSEIPDLKARAAVVLRMYGWSYPQIGAAIGGNRTGFSLCETGVRHIVKADGGEEL
jgi:hypothetical protein